MLSHNEQYVMTKVETELHRLGQLLRFAEAPPLLRSATVVWAADGCRSHHFALDDTGRSAACGERCQVAAERLVRRSRRVELQPCRGEMVHVAVPVICQQHYIATLWQSTSSPGTANATVRRFLQHLADYLAATWAQFSRQVDQETRTCTQELVEILLAGDVTEEARLRELMRRVGLQRLPSRVLLVAQDMGTQHDWRGELERFRAAIPGICAASLQQGEICVLLDGQDATATVGGILKRLTDAGLRSFRAGIGTVKPTWTDLLDSYHEARLALAGSDAPAAYHGGSSTEEGLAALSVRLRRSVARRDLAGARRTLASTLLRANIEIGRTTVEDIAVQRGFLGVLLSILADAAQHASGALAAKSADFSCRTLPPADNLLALHQAFLKEGDRILTELHCCLGDRHANLVTRARQQVEVELSSLAGAERVCIGVVAARLGVSVSHLSRVFHRNTGVTFQSFLAQQRVELARTLLLDPSLGVAEVSQRCGIPDATYFSRVFRKLTGQSPREYRTAPQRHA